MRGTIAKLMSDIARENGITILFAIENGSRAWDMASADSDYDIRFVFYRPVDDYLTLLPKESVITRAFAADLAPCDVSGSLFDLSGFDIFKYLKLLASSNPTTIEWLYSPIVYTGDNRIFLRDYMGKNFSQKKLFHHYFSLFKKTKNDIYEKGMLTHKKYLYAFRGLLNARYVYRFDALPPLSFADTVEKMQDDMPADVFDMIKKVIQIKSSGGEKDLIARIGVFDDYFAEKENEEYSVFSERRPDEAVLEKELKRILAGNA
ncbi:MAG: nucleotidyltransferase domain-containing protein [Alphaproteobacteria bacterium]|nr:nucleotidyltransferase domain-containing protein [Alphaproteobacteria bacterium]